MLEFMGNCMTSWRRSKTPHIDVTIAILGLDNSGKTVTSKSLQRVNAGDVEPTVGFESSEIECDNASITIFDLGGGSRIRDIWTNYLAEVHGVVFVVDSSTMDRMDECRRTLHQLLTDRRVNGKPVLILANKQDIQGSLDEIDVCEQLSLETLVNKVQCPCKIKMCSALPKSENGKLDISIMNGLNWLLDVIRFRLEDLDARREVDMTRQRNKESAERKARQERVQKLKDEKAKREQRERELRGETLEPSSDEDMNNTDDPFKRINASSFANKESKSKTNPKLSTFHSDDENTGNRRLSNIRKSNLDHFNTNSPSKTNKFDNSKERQNHGLTPITTRLEPLDALSDSRNKRKTRRNQTLPTASDDSTSNYLSAGKLNTQMSFRAHQRPKVSAEAPEVGDFASRWGIMDELPSLNNEI